ncbi:MAG: hypothetical protein V1676_01310 [Candidatus Diapherotrites archaeon]
MAAEQIKWIYAIVHPLFSIGEVRKDDRKLNAAERLFVKNRFDLFGRHILGFENEKNAIAVLIAPGSKIMQNKELKNNYKRFIVFAKKKLGDRLAILPPSLGYFSVEADAGLSGVGKRGLSRFKFDRNVFICAMGDHTGPGCVDTGAQNIKKLLEDAGSNCIVHIVKGASMQSGEITPALINFRKWRKRSANSPMVRPKKPH